MTAAIQTKAAYEKIKKRIREIQKETAKEVKALSRGIFIAASNASIKKGKGTSPKPGSKKAANGDWQPGPQLTVAYYTKSGKIIDPVTKWIEKLNKKNFTSTYKDRNGKLRKHKVSEYKMEPIGSQHEPLKLFEREYWRKGSKGNLSYSWGGPGLANYYIRKNWRTEETDKGVIVRISPTKFKGEKENQQVLKVLDEGGFTYGSKPLIGFHFIFARLKGGRTKIFPLYEYAKERPRVRIKGYNIKRNLVAKINRILKRVRASQISTQHWRQIGSGK